MDARVPPALRELRGLGVDSFVMDLECLLCDQDPGLPGLEHNRLRSPSRSFGSGLGELPT